MSAITWTKTIKVVFIGPQCDLPLEDIEWDVYLPSKWTLKYWDGTLNRVDDIRYASASFDLGSMIDRDTRTEKDKIKNAEGLLKLGNALVSEGKQMDARKALESAYALSLNDLDFNEDARVQWNNLRVQQAMVGLTTRRRNAFNAQGDDTVKLETGDDSQLVFSKKEGDELLSVSNSADENRALSELAQRFVSHQDAALRNPVGLSIVYPENGIGYLFNRSLQSNPWEAMRIETRLQQASTFSWVGMLVFGAAVFSLSVIVNRLGGVHR